MQATPQLTREEIERLEALEAKALTSFKIKSERDITGEYVSFIEGADPTTYRRQFVCHCDSRVSDETFELMEESRNKLSSLLSMARRSLELEEQVKPFADLPTHGKHGGPLVRIDAVYEDGSMQHLSHEKHEKLRAALSGDLHA